MTLCLKEFKEELQERLLTLLFRQWCTIGLYGDARPLESLAVDPEALLLLTCSLGRREPRLFDECLDWLVAHGSFMNTQRLSTMRKQYEFEGLEVLQAVAGFLQNFDKSAKWRSLSKGTAGKKTQPLFQFKDGRPMDSFGTSDPVFSEYGFCRGKVELRKYSQAFDSRQASCLRLKLRAFFGVNVRAEICLYLITHLKGAHPSLVARETGFYQKSIQDALVNMLKSGLVRCRTTGREKIYTLLPDVSRALLAGSNTDPQWIKWAPVLRFFESLWVKLDEADFCILDPTLQSAELRQLIKSMRRNLESSDIFSPLFDEPSPRGEDYLALVIQHVSKVIDELSV